MNSLPPLRTVRHTPPTAIAPVSPAVVPSVEMALPSMAATAKKFLQELVQADVLTHDEVNNFCRSADGKLQTLSSREQTAAALVRTGILTNYQATRILQGQTAGMRFGSYRVLDRLGSGSIGIVFLAEHRQLNRRVAVKVLNLTDETPEPIQVRFQKEMRIMATLRHDHIAAIYDAGIVPAASPEQSEMHYVAMEYLPGGDVENHVYEHGIQSVSQVCEWGRQVVSALRTAHSVGLVHRDVKPSNLLLDGLNRVRLIDFGLAREFDSVLTEPKVLVGSLEFLAPEQVIDAATAGPASDVYSLGMTLFWLFTGELPYEERSNKVSETVERILKGQLRKLSTVRDDLPDDLCRLIDAMLSRSADARPGCAEVEAVLDRHTSPLGDDLEQHRRSVRRLKGIIAAWEKADDQSRWAMLSALSAIVQATGHASAKQQARIAAYIECLSTELVRHADWPMLANRNFVRDLIHAAQARDIGLVGLKVESVQEHPKIGGIMLDCIAREHGPALSALRVARAVIEAHHERWDGTGYPKQLVGDCIPPAARITALLDRYDQLRVENVSHTHAVEAIMAEREKGFDPVIADAFEHVNRSIELIWRANPEHEEAELVPALPSRRQAFERLRKQSGFTND